MTTAVRKAEDHDIARAAATILTMHDQVTLMRVVEDLYTVQAERDALLSQGTGWKNEWPPTYDHVEEILLLLLGFHDYTWHNDASAHFTRTVRLGPNTVVACDVWIAGAVRADRESPDMARYTATFSRLESTDDYAEGDEMRDRRIEREDFNGFVKQLAREVFHSDRVGPIPSR
jgi:hypothetical protein